MSATNENAMWGHGTSDTTLNKHRQFTPDQQRLATLRARAAMANVQFHCFDDECTGATIYVVSRWAMTRQLESLDAAEKWLDLVTGVKS